jgi:phosphohistidine phosphatase
MRIVLMRHAEAASGPWADMDRPLTARGRSSAERSAAGLARLEPRLRRIVTSPALRARETAALVAAAWRAGPPRIEADALVAIGNDPRRVVESLRRSGIESTLVVGHAPDLSGIAAAFVGAPLHVRFDCAGAACFEVTDEFVALEWAMGPEVLAALGRDATTAGPGCG